MSIESGMYLITTEDNHPIGRWMIEDMSLLPKRVTIAKNFDPIHQDWMITNKGSGKYRMENSGAQLGLGSSDDLVLCALIPGMGVKNDPDWELTSAGTDLYTLSSDGKTLSVDTADNNEGRTWVKATSDSKQKFKLVKREQ